MSATRQPSSEKLFIDGPAGKLEALLEIPAKFVTPDTESGTESASGPTHVAVVCHPHPLHQGTMHNKVAHMLARSFVKLGAPTLRFNFRGVGESEGEHANAIGEVDDALAALDWMHERWPRAERWLGGFSFGSQVSLLAEKQRELDWLVTVAPPIDRIVLENFQRPRCPWLVIQGEEDELFNSREVEEWINSVSPRPDFEMFPEADHFFHGKLTKLREAVIRHAPA